MHVMLGHTPVGHVIIGDLNLLTIALIGKTEPGISLQIYLIGTLTSGF